VHLQLTIYREGERAGWAFYIVERPVRYPPCRADLPEWRADSFESQCECHLHHYI